MADARRTAPRRLDPAALAARCAASRAPAAPWLHGEVARRMAERLPLIRLQPQRVLDWWACSGAGASCWRAAYPKARRVRGRADAGARRTQRARRAAAVVVGRGAGARRAAEVVLEGDVAAAARSWCGPT